MTTTTSITRHLGRCPVKGCRIVAALDVEATGERSDRFGNVRHVITHGDWRRAVDSSPRSNHCPEHGRLLNWKPVKGAYSPDRSCDARCTSARGHNCECQCGGANHGADHLGG